MLERLWKGPERRQHRRFEAEIDLSIQVEMYGFEEDARPFFASGQTANISQGGVYALVDAPIAEGSVCKLFFRDAEAHVRPSHVAGRVVRCEALEDDDETFGIAVSFDAPMLEIVAEPKAVAGAESD